MCTALTFTQKDRYFGRTLDLEYRYSEEVVITPRKYTLSKKSGVGFKTDFAIIGIATVKDNYPLYYDAINEHGLAMAGLNFVENAKFTSSKNGYYNLAQYELIPFVLGRAHSVPDAIDILKRVRLTDEPYDEQTPVSELHYFLTDGVKSLAIEPAEDGLKIYENPFGVLTNNPPFPYHKDNVRNYMNLTAEESKNNFSNKVQLSASSRGLGAFGIPGDLSSPSRFVRGAFAVSNAAVKSEEAEAVGQVFHILDFVSQTEGLVRLGSGLERTQYAICANLNTGTYYYKTYCNSRITAITMKEELKVCDTISTYQLRFTEDICYGN